MEDIKKNYQSQGEIEEEPKNVRLESFLEINTSDEYVFGKCEKCIRPLLSHIEVKCGGREGVPYEAEAVKCLEYWIDSSI